VLRRRGGVATDILGRYVSFSVVGGRSEKGVVLLFGGATVPDRHHAGTRKRVFPDLKAQLRGEVAEEGEAGSGVHDAVAVRETREDAVCTYRCI
jgi:hypothetical protein